jgi:hypothetical protein
MDFLSRLNFDKRSHMDVQGCMYFADSRFWLTLQTPDILAVTGVITNKSFTYASYLVTPLNFSCAGDVGKFSSVDVEMPAYRCTNVTCKPVYLDNAVQVRYPFSCFSSPFRLR